MTDVLASLLLLTGLAFTLVGSLGLVRLPDVYTRIHAPTKATTLGLTCLLAAAALTLPGNHLAIAMKALLVVIFLFLTAPIAAQTLAHTARATGIRPTPMTHIDELPPPTIERAGLDPAHPGPD
ncbi:MAG TPA: monovalent cation/H(+) antiporter subunit G [Candidatus Binatia bacterium]|nr:monovalent cation/H(+) antiporter subunit G [Candidatus Binatia bacterium]